MYTLQQVLQYIAQVAGAGVSDRNVVAFLLAFDGERPWLLHANNDNIDIAIKLVVDEVVVAVGSWTSDQLPPPTSHEQFSSIANARELGSQSKARLKKILQGGEELTDSARQACLALKNGWIRKIDQPSDFQEHRYGGYGFIHAEMLLLNFAITSRMTAPHSGWSLGISKRLCAYCAVAVRCTSSRSTNVVAPGAHWLAYFRWRCPPFLQDELKGLVAELNRASVKGEVFVSKKVYPQLFVENTSVYANSGKQHCNLNVCLHGFSQQFGGMSPFRDEPSDEPESPSEDPVPETNTEVVWKCLNSNCELNYGRVVIPQHSGGMMSRLVCPFCAREVTQA